MLQIDTFCRKICQKSQEDYTNVVAGVQWNNSLFLVSDSCHSVQRVGNEINSAHRVAIWTENSGRYEKADTKFQIKNVT